MLYCTDSFDPPPLRSKDSLYSLMSPQFFGILVLLYLMPLPLRLSSFIFHASLSAIFVQPAGHSLPLIFGKLHDKDLIGIISYLLLSSVLVANKHRQRMSVELSNALGM